MGNPMLSLLNQNNSGVSQAVQMYKAYQAAQNPALMLQQLTAQNPILSQIRQMGGPAAGVLFPLPAAWRRPAEYSIPIQVILTGCTPFGNK